MKGAHSDSCPTQPCPQAKWAQQSLNRMPPQPKPPDPLEASSSSGRLIMQWLQSTHQVQNIIVILETRLAHDMEHMTTTHYAMHSTRQHAGVMILIHKRLAPIHRVTCRVLTAGRLVHARLYGTRSHVDIVGFYQQAWQPTQVGSCLKRRAQLTAQLNQLLLECSSNQLLFLGGDFNTDLPPASPYIGDAVEPNQARPGPRQPDWQQLRALICRHGLCALNAFQSGRQRTRAQDPKKSRCRVG